MPILSAWLMRWKYRLLSWLFYRPDMLKRSTKVEGMLYEHYRQKTSPTPEECREMARILMISDKWREG